MFELIFSCGKKMKLIKLFCFCFLFLQKSFQRESYFDWNLYNTLTLRVRGDGRPYLLILKSDGIFDVTWNDCYHYILYTRGGPHWQLTKVRN